MTQIIKATKGNRGKLAERIFKAKVLDVQCRNATNVGMRLADAYEGSGREVPADFLWLRHGTVHIVEVKSCQMVNRLPYHNFPPEQVARLRRWRDAGAIPWVAIHHPSLTACAWRKIPGEVFYNRNPEKPSGSWNLEQFALLDLEDWDSV